MASRQSNRRVSTCAVLGHEFDRQRGIGRCAHCEAWVMTAVAYERASRHAYAGPNDRGGRWALIPASLGGGLALDVELDESERPKLAAAAS